MKDAHATNQSNSSEWNHKLTLLAHTMVMGRKDIVEFLQDVLAPESNQSDCNKHSNVHTYTSSDA